VIGNYGLSPGQSRAQMALWSIMASPLILSVDLKTIPDWARDIVLNKNLIAINQDPLGTMGRRILQVITTAVPVLSRNGRELL
jgi:Alpha galactosidase A